MDRRKNRYIESEKGQTRMYQARKVHDWALPDCSHETNETLGVDLMQKERRSNEHWVGMGIDVRNPLGARREKVERVLSWECVDKMQEGQRVWECIVKI